MKALWRADARKSLSFFLEYVTGGAWKPAPHLELLCSKLEAVERGEITRLIVEMPPRHGKSEVTSKHFPAWFLGRNPDKEIILTSYGAELAFDFSRIARDVLAEWGEVLFGVRLSPVSSAVGRWEIAGHRGGLSAAGVGGPITGRGAHVAIIDDPVKNAEEANSKTYREAVWNWYRTTLRTRLAPGGAVVLVLTRWHEDDLAGRLLKEMQEGGEQWEVLRLPALAEEDDPLGRKPGEPLWEERYDLKELALTKRTLTTYWWNALYQQRPSPPTGSVLKREWWKFYRQAPDKFDEVLQSWDMSFKETDDGSFVVGQVWGRKGADKYLLDQVRARMDFPTTIQAVRTLSAKWLLARLKLVEDKANGPAVVATLKKEIPGLVAVEPQGSKEARAAAASPDIEAGNVYLPDPGIAPWVHDFIEECAAFPNGANDDQVDAMTQALNRFMQRRQIGPVDKPKGW